MEKAKEEMAKEGKARGSRANATTATKSDTQRPNAEEKGKVDSKGSPLLVAKEAGRAGEKGKEEPTTSTQTWHGPRTLHRMSTQQPGAPSQNQSHPRGPDR